MSSPFNTVAAAADIPHAIFFLVPLFAIAIALVPRSLSYKPPTGPHARRAYLFIGLLTLLSILTGVLPLPHTTPPIAVAVVQALLSFFLGLPVLHLASTPPYAPSNITTSALQIAHTTILVISISGATLTALVLPSSAAASPQYLPSVLFLLYSILALLRTSSTLFYFLRPLLSQRRSARSSSSSSAYFFHRNRNRSSSARRPITIHIETQRTSIPLSLSSHASSAASLHYFSPDGRLGGDLTRAQEREERPIELELALPNSKRKEKDSRSRSRVNDEPDGRYLYQGEKDKNLTIDTTLVVEKRLSSPHHQNQDHRQHQDHQQEKEHQRKTKHEKSTSIDSKASSASTLTVVDHTQRKRRSLSAAPIPIPIPLPLEGLATPPRAIHPTPNSNPNSEPAPFSTAATRQGVSTGNTLHEDAFVVVLGSNSNSSSSAIVHPVAGDSIDHFPSSNSIRFRDDRAYTRSRTLLILLFGAQIALVVGYACAVGIGESESLESFRSASSHSTALLSLKIVQSITTVLAITGTMSAYLLHAYNTHLSPSRSRRSRATAATSATAVTSPPPPPPPPSAYKSRTPSSAATFTPFGYSNPTSAKSASALISPNGNGYHYNQSPAKHDRYSYSRHHQQEQPHHQHQEHPRYNNPKTPASASAVALNNHHQSNIQIAETRTSARPVIIQLAPPPPPRTRRRRVDAFGHGMPSGDGGHTPAGGRRDSVTAGSMSMSMSMAKVAKERERMDVPRSVSISVSASVSNGSNGSNLDSSEDGGAAPFSYASSYPRSEGVYYPQSQPSEAHAFDDTHNHEYQREGGYRQMGYRSISMTSSDYIKNAYKAGSYGQHRTNGEHLYYDHDNAPSNLYARPQPITLTYEPPVISGGMSLLETTETEGDDDLDSDFEDDVDDNAEEWYQGKERKEMNGNGNTDMGMNVDDMDSELDLEGEMEKALSLSLESLSLSRSSSMASRMSGSGDGYGVRVGVTRKGTSSANAHDNKSHSRTHQQQFNNPKPPQKSKPNPKPKPKPKSKKPVEDPATYIKKRGSMPAVPRPRKLFGWEFGWDSHVLTGMGRRGSMSATTTKNSSSSKGTVREEEPEREMKENEATEASFMDFKGAAVGAGGGPPLGGDATGPTRKLKRHSTPAGSLYRSIVGGGSNAKEREKEKQEKWEEVFGGRDAIVGGGVGYGVGPPAISAAQASIINMNLESKKLKKMRSDSSSLRPAGAATGALASRGVASSSSGGSTLNGNTGNSHRITSSGSSTSRPSRPVSGDSGKTGVGNRASLNNGRGLQLKRSFKLSVGRTLGPGLTLASAGVVDNGKGEGEKQRDDDGNLSERRPSDDRPSSMGDEEDVDVDGEIQSITAARLVSASIARATPAATIVTAPLTNATISSPSPSSNSHSNSSHSNKSRPLPVNPTLSSNVPQRPILHAIVTSAPIPIPTPNAIPFPMSAPASRRPPTGLSPAALSPANTRQPPHTSGSNWKPHPFADLMDPLPATMSPYTTASSEGVASVEAEDEVVLLERAMEGIRGRRGDGSNLMESPTIQFRELEAAMGVHGVSVSASPPTPLMSSSMTPSLNNMFALAHAQAQTIGPPSPTIPSAAAVPTTINTSTMTTGGTSEKMKSKIFGGGQPQKRMALSSPPASKSDWGPQSSAGPTGAGGGFPYRFPMIFPHSFTGSPPRPGVQANGQATPRPGTPRGGGTTLRLSAMTMSTVRNTFAGIGARMSSATSRRMSMNSTVGGFKVGDGNAFGEMVMEDTYGDFMDLRDPFASPPPTATVAIVPPSPPVVVSQRKVSRSKADAVHAADVLDTMNSGYDVGVGQVHNASRKKMSAWGKLPVPVPVRSFSPAPSAGSENAPSGAKRHSFIISGRIVGKPSAVAHRKHKKERRTRKATLPSMVGAMAGSKAGAEDSDFGLEEALLSQRLLNRLVSDGWESRM